MIQVTKDGIVRSLDVGGMLFEDMIYLVESAKLSTVEFIEIAEKMELPTGLWSKFWAMINE